MPDEKTQDGFTANLRFAVAVVCMVMATGGLSAAQTAGNEFVQRSGTRLTLGGQDYRYSGPNIEWLGIEAYGPDDSMGPRYPSHLEVDDALDTAKMLGARVVRSQTMGDSVGCDVCLEPKAGVFNPDAFKATDYAIKAAHDRGLRLVITLVGDCSNCERSGMGEYLSWKGKQDYKQFFTDPGVIAAFEEHIRALLEHKNALTGIAYKDDPTILAWENCNVCGLFVAGSWSPEYIAWLDTIGSFIKSIDKKHLYQDNSGFFFFDQKALEAKTIDIVTAEYYPHWTALFGQPGHKTTPETFSTHAALVTGKGKVYVACEYGWDVTNWPTPDDLQKLLHTLESDPNISGDGYWALQAHADKFGWQPMSAPANNPSYTKWGETGQWWSIFYGGVNTLAHSAQEMQARVELLRTHSFAMAGTAAPPHPVPAPPIITFKGIGILGWRGSVGAVVYSVQRRVGDSAPWETICDRCATDADTPWVDEKAAKSSFATIFSTKYRVIAYNAEGKGSEPSKER